MSAAIIPFTFNETEVRTLNRGGEPWFVLTDVCKVLEIRNPSDAAGRLDDDEKSTLAITEGGNFNGLGAIGAMPIVINESGLYSLVLTSRKPEAKRFKKWITREVIPAIRRTGAYTAPLSREQQVAQALLLSQQILHEKEQQIAVLAPKAEVHDRIANADGSLTVTEAAKTLAVPPKRLFDWLKQNGWIYRRPGSSHWLGYQTRTNAGDLEHKVNTVERPDGTSKITEQVRITARGLTKLAKLLQPVAA